MKKPLIDKLLKISLYLFIGILLTGISGCKKDKNTAYNISDNFNSLSPEKQIEDLTSRMAPSQVAEFLCKAALDKIPNVKINLSEANSYVYQIYSDKDQIEYIDAFENYVNSSPLAEKMRLRKLSAMEDNAQLGYDIGLDYLSNIRENKKSVDDIKKEINDLKKACQTDKDFYRRFMIGFKYALNKDRNVDLDEKIYNTFIIYEDTLP